MTYDLVWAHSRRNIPLKLYNYPVMQKLVSLISATNTSHSILYRDAFSTEYDKIFKHYLLADIGLPNVEQCKLTPTGYLLTRFPKLNLWLDMEIDSNILGKFTSLSNTRYLQPEVYEHELPDEFILFSMQNPRTIDLNYITHALSWAKDNKKHIVFKPHPIPIATEPPIKETWNYFSKLGYLSSYSHLIDVGNIEYLITKAYANISVNSATALNSLLLRKPTATFKDNQFIDIVPKIRHLDQLSTLPILAEEQLMKYLSWYYHRLVIDINNPTHHVKIKNIINKYFIEGLTEFDIFKGGPL